MKMSGDVSREKWKAMKKQSTNYMDLLFFEKLDEYFETTINPTMRKVLLLCDYDSIAVLKDLNDDQINGIEMYIQNVFDESMLIETETMRDFLGRFVDCKHKFQFTLGQRQWLQIIANKCKDLNSKRPIKTNHIRGSQTTLTNDDLKSLCVLLRNWTLQQNELSKVRETLQNCFLKDVHLFIYDSSL